MDYVINFGLFVLGVCLTLLIKNYLPKYAETKGANRANEEDIPKLTRAVESIKAELSQQGEFLKARLSFSNQHRLNWKTAEREALAAYNKAVAAYLYYVVRFPLHTYHLENYNDLQAASAQISRLSYEYDIAATHIDLFVRDLYFVETKRNLIMEIYNISALLDSIMLKVKLAAQEAEIDIQFALTPNEMSLARNSFNQKRSELLSEFLTEMKAIHAVANGHYKEILKMIFNRFQESEGQ